MPLNTNTVEQLAEWCLKDDSLVDVRATARREFFGYDERMKPLYERCW